MLVAEFLRAQPQLGLELWDQALVIELEPAQGFFDAGAWPELALSLEHLVCNGDSGCMPAGAPLSPGQDSEPSASLSL